MALRRFILLLAFVFSSILLKANRPFPDFLPLSEQSKITLLTCDPGNQLYTTFGHSAIRVYDPMQGCDFVFNYGTFNFNVPHFYAKFASGKLLYRLSFESYRQFMTMYVHESRSVIEQELDLTVDQKEVLLNQIRENYKIENRFYKYDFFFDNCATRIIDIFNATYPDSLNYKPNNELGDKTFRGLLSEYLGNSDWSSVGIDLMLGKVTDVPATDLQKSFLPDYLLKYMQHTYFNDRPFVKNERYLLKGTFEMPKTPFLLSPKFWFWLLAAMWILLSLKFNSKPWVIADKALFIIIGTVGLLVFLATYATDHGAMRDNMNLLWINPLYLVLAGFVGSKYWRVTLALSLLLLFSNLVVLIGWSVLPQVFHPNFIPIIIMVTLRLSIIGLRLRNK